MHNHSFPPRVLWDKDITKVDLGVYGIIRWCETMYNGKCTMSNEAIASKIGCAPGSVKRSVRDLRAKGYIEVLYSGSTPMQHRLHMKTVQKDEFFVPPEWMQEGQNCPYNNKSNKNLREPANMAKNKAKAKYLRINDPAVLLKLEKPQMHWLVKRTKASYEQIEREAEKVYKWLTDTPAGKKHLKNLDVLFRLETWINNARRKGWLKPTDDGAGNLLPAFEDGSEREWDNGNGTSTFVSGFGKNRTEYTRLNEELREENRRKFVEDLKNFPPETK